MGIEPVESPLDWTHWTGCAVRGPTYTEKVRGSSPFAPTFFERLGQVDTPGLVGIRLVIVGFGRDWSGPFPESNKVNSSFTKHKSVLHSTPLHTDGAYSFISIDLKENPWHKLLLLAERLNYNDWKNS